MNSNIYIRNVIFFVYTLFLVDDNVCSYLQSTNLQVRYTYLMRMHAALTGLLKCAFLEPNPTPPFCSLLFLYKLWIWLCTTGCTRLVDKQGTLPCSLQMCILQGSCVQHGWSASLRASWASVANTIAANTTCPARKAMPNVEHGLVNMRVVLQRSLDRPVRRL